MCGEGKRDWGESEGGREDGKDSFDQKYKQKLHFISSIFPFHFRDKGNLS